MRAALLALCAAACTRDFDPARFDLAAARRTDDLHVERRPSAAAARVRVEEVSWSSTEWSATGAAHEIRLHGYLARPAGERRRPAVLIAHGLGQQADRDVAIDVAADLDAVALALSGPGMGQSTGRPLTFDDPRPLFDAAADVRASWLYAYVYAVLRGITLLAADPGVDAARIVASGTSLGGVAVLDANGADDRLSGVVAVSASGGLAASAAEGSWFARLVGASGGLRPGDPGPTRVFRGLDPLAFARRQHGAVAMVAGAQDEFFPLDQVVRTFAALRAPGEALALVPNYDHDWYLREGHDDAIARWAALLRALVRGTALPPPPRIVTSGADVNVRAPGARAARIVLSEDGGATYARVPAPLGRPLRAGAIVFAEAEMPGGVIVTSAPELPPAFRPVVRAWGAPPDRAAPARP